MCNRLVSVLFAFIGFITVSCYRSIDLSEADSFEDSTEEMTDTERSSEQPDSESETEQDTDDTLPVCEPAVNPRVYWSFSLAAHGWAFSGNGEPIISGSYVYLRDGLGNVVIALRAMDGTMQWFNLADPESGTDVQIAVGSKGDVYATYLNPGYVTVAFDRYDGRAERRTDTGSFSMRQNAPAYGPDDKMYLSGDNCFGAEDPENGGGSWGLCFLETGTQTPVFGPGGIVYVLGNRQLYAYRSEDESEYWLHPEIGDLTVPSSSGLVFRRTGADRTRISAVDASTGQTRWTHSRSVEVSSLVDAPGNILVGTEGDAVFTLNTLDGSLLWSRFLVGKASTPVLAGGDLVFVYTGHVLYALHLTTGTVLWTAGMDGDVSGVVSGPDGVIYVTSAGGFLLAMDARTAEIRWVFYAAQPPYPPFIASDGTLLLPVDAALFALSPDENATGEEVFCKPCAFICDALHGEIRRCLPDGSGSQLFRSCADRKDCEMKACQM